LVGLTDLPVSLVDAAGLAIPDNWFGQSLRRLVVDGEWDRTDITGGYHDSDGNEHIRVREADWKLVRHGDDEADELYNLDADPGEQTNVIDSHPEQVRRLEKELDTHRRLVESTQTDDVERPDMDEDVKERLRRLGYNE